MIYFNGLNFLEKKFHEKNAQRRSLRYFTQKKRTGKVKKKSTYFNIIKILIYNLKQCESQSEYNTRSLSLGLSYALVYEDEGMNIIFEKNGAIVMKSGTV